jgi:hypothetical protein
MHPKAGSISLMARFPSPSVSASVASGARTQGNRRVVQRYVLFAAIALVLCAPARADMIWEWTYSGNQWTGSGELITESTLTDISGFTGYLILGMSGTWDSLPIIYLLPPANFFNNDNLLSPSQPQLDSFGLAFGNTDSNYNISYAGPGYQAFGAGFADNGQGIFSATAVATPEPATAVLVGPIVLAFALFVRHRKIKAQ